MLMAYLHEFLIRSADVVRMALFLQELLHPLLVFGLPSLGRLEFHMHCQVAIDDVEIRISRPHSHLLQEACLHLGSLSLVGTMEPEEVTVAVGEIPSLPGLPSIPSLPGCPGKPSAPGCPGKP